jgi:hypothetical protein
LATVPTAIEPRQAADSVADVAVCCEPFSASNSLITSENIGNYSILDVWVTNPLRIMPCLLWCFFGNSLLTGTGNFEMRAGNYFGGAANLLEQQGRR